MITQYSNFKYGNIQVSKLYQGETLVWPPDTSYEYYTPTPVDLGLSVKWASFSLGSSVPGMPGYRYAWGEIIPKATSTYNIPNGRFSWGNYKWCQGTDTTLTKYNTNSSFGVVDNKTKLSLDDDAARVNLGGTWRMPTSDEFTELINNCTWTWEDTMHQMRVTSNVSGYTNNYIILSGGPPSTRPYGYVNIFWASTMPTSQRLAQNGYALEIKEVLSDDGLGHEEWVTGKRVTYYGKAQGWYDAWDYIMKGGEILPVCP